MVYNGCRLGPWTLLAQLLKFDEYISTRHLFDMIELAYVVMVTLTTCLGHFAVRDDLNILFNS